MRFAFLSWLGIPLASSLDPIFHAIEGGEDGINGDVDYYDPFRVTEADRSQVFVNDSLVKEADFW